MVVPADIFIGEAVGEAAVLEEELEAAAGVSGDLAGVGVPLAAVGQAAAGDQ